MRQKGNNSGWLTSAVAALAVVGATYVGVAQTTNNPNGFDTSSSTKSWVTWWGPPSPTITWDSTLDASNNPTSGSMKYVENFTTNVNEQFMTFGTIANGYGWDRSIILDCTLSTNLVLDIKIDPSTAPSIYNDYGNLEFGLVTFTGTNTWGRQKVGSKTLPLSATAWTHLVLPISPTTPNLNSVVGTYIYTWSGGRFTNTLTFNVDNIWIEPLPTTNPPPPPPTLTLSRAVSGLNLLTTTLGDANQRESIHTFTNLYSWVGASGPVTYAVTLKQQPDTAHQNFQTHLFLVPGAQTTNLSGTLVWTNMPWGPGDSAVDWNATNIVFVQLGNAADGGGNARFMYKTNQGSGNSMLWNANPVNGPVGTLATLNGQVPLLGTWSLTFNQDTNITITAPNGNSTNFVMPPEAAALFSGPLYAYIGGQPNAAGNVGQSSILSRVQITGTASNLNDTFPGPGLDPTLWGLAAAYPSCIQVVTPADLFWLSWTLPDQQFGLESSPSLIPGSWTVSGLTNVLQLSQKTVLVPTSSLPGANVGYYRMVKRVASKLQVLLPGETNAPGTLTGKTGTPLAQHQAAPVTVTVNAVDDAWHIVPTLNDTVTFTSTDTSAALPSDGPLANGTGTFTAFFISVGGPWTITASDVTNTNIVAGTSSPVTIIP